MSDKVLTANHLLSGEVVFLAEGELWTPRISEALIAENDEEERWLEQAGARAVGAQIIVEPYLIDVTRHGGATRPVRFREKIRTLGPTVRPDLGKQAELEDIHASAA
jgi:hypothetical protein